MSGLKTTEDGDIVPISVEDRLFQRTDARTGESVWLYFFEDEEGKNQHSRAFLTKEEAHRECVESLYPEVIASEQLIEARKLLEAIIKSRPAILHLPEELTLKIKLFLNQNTL